MSCCPASRHVFLTSGFLRFAKPPKHFIYSRLVGLVTTSYLTIITNTVPPCLELSSINSKQGPGAHHSANTEIASIYCSTRDRERERERDRKRKSARTEDAGIYYRIPQCSLASPADIRRTTAMGAAFPTAAPSPSTMW